MNSRFPFYFTCPVGIVSKLCNKGYIGPKLPKELLTNGLCPAHNKKVNLTNMKKQRILLVIDIM